MNWKWWTSSPAVPAEKHRDAPREKKPKKSTSVSLGIAFDDFQNLYEQSVLWAFKKGQPMDRDSPMARWNYREGPVVDLENTDALRRGYYHPNGDLDQMRQIARADVMKNIPVDLLLEFLKTKESKDLPNTLYGLCKEAIEWARQQDLIKKEHYNRTMDDQQIKSLIETHQVSYSVILHYIKSRIDEEADRFLGFNSELEIMISKYKKGLWEAQDLLTSVKKDLRNPTAARQFPYLLREQQQLEETISRYNTTIIALEHHKRSLRTFFELCRKKIQILEEPLVHAQRSRRIARVVEEAKQGELEAQQLILSTLTDLSGRLCLFHEEMIDLLTNVGTTVAPIINSAEENPHEIVRTLDSVVERFMSELTHALPTSPAP
jgi:hypothetical protein